jgi:hypothetical protein
MVKNIIPHLRKSILAVFMLLIFFAGNTSAQNISARAFTDTSDYLIGDYIHYTIVAEYNKEISIFRPDITGLISNIDVISEAEPQTVVKGDTVTTTYKLILSRYDSSEVVIPPIEIKYGINIDTSARVPFLAEKDTTLLSAFTNEVKFSVSAVKVNIEEDIKDIKQPITIPPDWRIIALWILAVLIIAGAAVYFYLKYKKRKAAAPIVKKIIVIPPHVRALAELNVLEKQQLWQKGEIKEYHSRITEIVRNYFEERFKMPALELSTSEIMIYLEKQPGAEDIKELTSAFLNNADLVKFAKYIPLNSINEEMMKQAVEIVERTIPKTTLKETENV